jgi:hypothetical protein
MLLALTVALVAVLATTTAALAGITASGLD